MTALAPATRLALSAFGYADNLILEDYRVWLGERDVIAVDGAAFGSMPTDMTTSTIVVSQINNGSAIPRLKLREAALAMAAPVAIEADNSRLRVFSVDWDSELALIEDLDLEQAEAFERFRSELGPRALLEAKLGSRQLSLFPIDASLLTSARTRARDALTVRLDASLRAIAELVGESSGLDTPSEFSSRQALLRSSRILVGALTCAYIRDKNNFGDLPSDALPRIAQIRYPTYFEWLQETPYETDLLVAAIDELSEGMSFRGLAPDVVTEPYERVLVSSAERRELGIHYTPTEIAELMLKALPFEELHPEQRKILDPTCGSGTLLLAAYDRLREADSTSFFQSTDQLGIEHQRLTGQLHGYDQDPFAVQITKLALLLHDQSGGNGWNVAVQDTLAKGVLPSSSVLIANPPWLFDSRSTGGDRTERANRFVHMILDTLTPGGLLGLILPSSWLTSMASRTTRNRMTEECELFEVWRLPETVFRSSRTAPAIICARKRSGEANRSWRIFRRVVADDNDLKRFYATGVASDTFLLESEKLLTGPLTVALSKKRGMIQLAEIADIREGSVPKPSVTKGKPKSGGSHFFLKNARMLRPFGEPPQDALAPVDFPADFYWNTPLTIAAAHKVLVSATRWADNPWRLKVGIDLQGIIVRNSLNVIIPKATATSKGDTDTTLFALMALLGSGLASLWVDEHATKRSPSEDTFRSLPIPSGMDWTGLARLGRRLLEDHHNSQSLRRTAKELEDFIWRAYDIDQQTLSKLVWRLSIKSPPEGGTRYPASPANPGDLHWLHTERTRSGETRIGAVFDIEEDGLRIWINSVTPSEGMKITVPTRFPGALLYPDATFETDATSVPDIPTSRYWLQQETWRDDEELEEYVKT